MLADSYIVPECIARPGSFGGLMTLYEANYIKLTQLRYTALVKEKEEPKKLAVTMVVSGFFRESAGEI